MKKILLSLAVAMLSTGVFAQDWSLDKSHANVGFTVVHLKISDVDGHFSKFDAKINSSKEDFSDASIDFTADVNTVNTGIGMRDKDLLGEGWFHAEKHPTISFKSTSVKKVAGTKYQIVGNLTMKGVTKPITLDAVLRGPIDAQGGKKKIGLTANGTVDRSIFGVGKSGGSVDNDVVLRVSGEFTK